MSKHAELGPEPTVNMGDHAAAQKRADEIGAFLREVPLTKVRLPAMSALTCGICVRNG